MAPKADEDPLITVRRAAMNLLARREQSFFELIQKLSEKYPDLDKAQVILPALERLRDENLQSDARFVEAYVRYRQTRGMGPLKIGMELGQKGINDKIIHNEIYNTGIDWIAHCRKAANKKEIKKEKLSISERGKRYRFLAQRGFEVEQIKTVLDEL